ncbi:hypothetical protein GW17_00033798 [Ensete ventricosum]|nr:hypothetical protein GW17_00033798 [Ensete ventricosum]
MALASCFSPPFRPPLCAGGRSLSPVACACAQTAATAPAAPSLPKALPAILDSRLIACLRAQEYFPPLVNAFWNPCGYTAMEAACAALSGGISVVSPLRKLFSFSNYIRVYLPPLSNRTSFLKCVARDCDVYSRCVGGCFLFLNVIRGLLKDYPSSLIGVGTVLNAEDARKAVKAGAQFLMSPGTVMVLFAYNAGARIIKVSFIIFFQSCKMIITTLKLKNL